MRAFTVSPARHQVQACVQPLYGLIVHRNGIRDAFGTLFSTERARTS